MENKNNRLILQSYTLTAIRNNFGLYAQRLIVRIAEKMQYRLQDADFATKKITPTDKRLEWEFKVADIAMDNNNYAKVKADLRKVLDAKIYYENSKYWEEGVLFTNIKYEDGNVSVKINDTYWNLFIEFSKGYKRYELETALSLKSRYSLRLYQLLSENEQPITYTIEWLKKFFGVEDKYKLTKDFVKKVIIPTQKELDETSPMSFDYSLNVKSKGRGRPVITGITFIVRKTDKNTNFELREKEINRKYGDNALPNNLRHKLEQGYEFTEKGIRANARLFYEAYTTMSNPTLLEFLDEKRAKAFRTRNPQGWIINAIKGELETL